MGSISRNTPTRDELDDAAIADAVRSFIALEARDWQRRQRARLLTPVLRLVDEARERGDAPDVAAFIRQVWLDRKMPELPESK